MDGPLVRGQDPVNVVEIAFSTSCPERPDLPRNDVFYIEDRADAVDMHRRVLAVVVA